MTRGGRKEAIFVGTAIKMKENGDVEKGKSMGVPVKNAGVCFILKMRMRALKE